MSQRRYKVLTLPRFFGNNLWAYTHIVENEDDTPLTEEEARPLVIEDLVEEGLKSIEPTFYRDGWYFDRQTKQCWYEWQGTAWQAKSEEFLHELSHHNEPWLTTAEVEAIRTLIVYGNAPKSLIERLWRHQERIMLRDIRRNARTARHAADSCV